MSRTVASVENFRSLASPDGAIKSRGVEGGLRYARSVTAATGRDVSSPLLSCRARRGR